MTKSMIDGKPIEYDPRWPLRPIIAERITFAGCGCICHNCGGNEAAFMVKLNETSFYLPNGDRSEKKVAMPQSLWLCPDCLEELRKAINEVDK